MDHNVNLALQVLPLGIAKEDAYRIIDEAIMTVQASGLKYQVCPFETVIEGAYRDVMELIDKVQETCNKAGATEVLINMKLQRNFTKDVSISDKTGKYE